MPCAARPASLALLILNVDHSLNFNGCPGCNVTNVTFDSGANALQFQASQGSNIKVAMPAVSTDFTIGFFVNFAEACGNASQWWHGCGLVTAQADTQKYRYVGCFGDLPSLPDFAWIGQRRIAHIDQCHTHCKSYGTAYFTVVYDMCGCTNNFGTYGKFPDQSCHYRQGALGCGVNGNTCGGYLKNSIYTVASPTDFGVSISGGQIMMGINSMSPVRGQPRHIVSPNSYNDGAWHHVIATREQSTGEYWLTIDYVEVGRVWGPTATLSGPTTVSIGGACADLGGKPFTGLMYARAHLYYNPCVRP